jgi:L-threonylcarbamoyladenylate synthase
MPRIALTAENASEVARTMIQSVRNGDLILFPTDTVYGLGGLAFSRRVMEKLQQVKPERPGKPTAVLIDNIIRMSQCSGEVPSRRIVALAETFWPGSLTLVWHTSKAIPEEFQTPDHSLGFRVPKSRYLLEALEELETPIWATSANLPGQPPPRLFTEIRSTIIEACDLVIETHELLTGRASSIVDVRGKEPVIIREAGIREEQILKVWKGA